MTPPDEDTIEVSVFGPGVGECIVLHLGHGAWFVVDSCLSPGGRPVALNYLESLSVSPEQIVGVLVTHWHDDHIGGAAAVLAEATNALFYCPAAFKDENLATLIDLQRGSLMTHKSGVSELGDIFDVLLSRRARYQQTASVGPELVMASQRIYSSASTELWALSPSSAEVTKSLQAFAQLIPHVKEPQRAVRFRENHASIVLQLLMPQGSVLLGADMERTTNPRTGWEAIINAAGRPRMVSNTYKVAHHGAPNGDRGEIWSTLLTPEPRAVVTPYRPSKRPREADIERLKKQAAAVYVTAPAEGKKPARSHRLVDKMMASSSSRTVLRQAGHVRVRVLDGRCDLETFGAAYAA